MFLPPNPEGERPAFCLFPSVHLGYTIEQSTSDWLNKKIKKKIFKWLSPTLDLNLTELLWYYIKQVIYACKNSNVTELKFLHSGVTHSSPVSRNA